MPETNRRWVYPTITASENKGIERIALTGEGTAHEVVGIDGSRRFGCRPSSGFRLAHTLDIYKDFSGSGARPYSDTAPPTQNKTSTVTDCYPVHFQIREGEFGHGFVYRVKATGSTNSAIYMDFVPTNTVDSATGWRTILVSDHSSGAGGHISSNDKIDVVSMGKYVYVLVQGRVPRVFYIDFDGSSTYTHKVVNGGPGPRPQVRSHDAQQTATEPLAVSASGRASGSLTTSSVLWGQLIESSSDPGNSSDKYDFNIFKKGDYTFAYYLHDSQTGRRSALSEISTRREDGDSIHTDGRRIGFALEIDKLKYDQIYIFRSVKLQSVGGAYAGSILQLDTIYNISDAVDTSNAAYKGISEVDTSGNSVYPGTGVDIEVYKVWYQLNDLALSMQDVYLDRTIYEDEMPYAGSGVSFGGTLIVSDPKGQTAVTSEISARARDIGEIRWSSLTERSPELFPINNKHVPDVYQNRVENLARAGEFAIGFSKDRLYHIRRNGIFFKIEDLHEGFGLIGDNAFASAGPLCYFVTSKGLKAIANNGQLDDVQSLDNLLLDDWYSNLSSLRMAFDSYASCMFILSPENEKTVCMWFGTGRISEFQDTVFSDVRSGVWPESFTRNVYDDTTPTPTTTTTMVERAFFLQVHPDAGTSVGSEVPDNYKPRVYILDLDRDKVQVNSTDVAVDQPRLRTLDGIGDSIFEVHGVSTSGGTTTVTLKSGTSGTKNLGGPAGSSFELIGSKVYIIKSATEANVGTSEVLYSSDKGTVTSDGSSPKTIKIKKMSSLAVGDTIAISPMVVRYVGGSLPMVRTENLKVTTRFDLFQNKQISSIGCHFTDVSGGVTGYKFFQGQVYNTESDSAAVTAFPTDFSGTIIGDSVKNGESDDYAAFTKTGLTTKGKHGIQDSALNPGIEIFCPDLDFKLMALICRGRTTNTDTGDRNTP